jgi:hypothetical protein
VDADVEVKADLDVLPAIDLAHPITIRPAPHALGRLRHQHACRRLNP